MSSAAAVRFAGRAPHYGRSSTRTQTAVALVRLVPVATELNASSQPLPSVALPANDRFRGGSAAAILAVRRLCHRDLQLTEKSLLPAGMSRATEAGADLRADDAPCLDS